VKAVNKFKSLVDKNKLLGITSILGDHGDAHFSHPPAMMQKEHVSLPPKSHSFNTFGREHPEEARRTEGISHDMSKLNVRPVPTLSIDDTTQADGKTENSKVYSNSSALLSGRSTDTEDSISRIQTTGEMESLDPQHLPPFRSLKPHARTTDEIGHRGHAHDPLEDQLYLYIGPSTFSGTSSNMGVDGAFVSGDDEEPIVSESPGAADVDIYETAYRDEIERIMARAKEEKREPNVYLTRRVDAKLIADIKVEKRHALGRHGNPYLLRRGLVDPSHADQKGSSKN